MIRFENGLAFGFLAAIRGMRNPYDSWDKSDTDIPDDETTFNIGPADLSLMKRLAKGGPVHAKYRRFITVSVDITAPLYWWKEFDTYKVGTVANSCSTMHTIANREFSREDFSCEHLQEVELGVLDAIIKMLNNDRELYLEKKRKEDWWQLIQLLPSSYNQKRTVQFNYEVLSSIYASRKDHKLDEWRVFCNWIEKLPHAEGVIFSREK